MLGPSRTAVGSLEHRAAPTPSASSLPLLDKLFPGHRGDVRKHTGCWMCYLESHTLSPPCGGKGHE